MIIIRTLLQSRKQNQSIKLLKHLSICPSREVRKYLDCLRSFKYLQSITKILGATKLSGKKNKRRKDSEVDDILDCTSADGNAKKKMRTTFTGKQIFELEKSFESKKYLSSAERAEMASSLRVTQQQADM